MELKALLLQVGDLAHQAVAATNIASPQFVDVRAKAVISLVHAAHPVEQIAAGDPAGFANRADYSHWFVTAVLALRDQYRQAQISVGLERDRKSVVGVRLST